MEGGDSVLFQQIPRDEFLQGFVQYLEQHHLRNLEAVVQEADMSRHFSVEDLLDTNVQLGTLLLSHCDELLPVFDEALVAAQRRVLEAQSQSVRGIVKPFVHVRVAYLPPVPENIRENVSSIRACDTNRFIQVPGTVIRTAMIKVLELKRVYECGNPRCKHQFEVVADVKQGYTLEMPRSCPSNDQENRQRRCKSTTFHEIEDRRVCCDCQEIKIQEQVQKLSVGMIPRTVTVLLENDLVDGCKAGDDVVVTGVVMQRWLRTIRDKRCEVELVIRANHIRHNNSVNQSALPTDEMEREFLEFWQRHAANPLRGRNILVGSVCPQVYGLFLVKLAVAVTLAGGVGHVDDRGVKLRGEPHLLLVGDPGTGKSQFLRFSCKLCPRSVMTTGVGTTSAGLTCTAVKEGTEWMLEAGALVLADGGLCAIDEFGNIRPHDRATIHEAMEQQTLSVAKAGLVTTLNTRATVIAATNPKGTYDPTVDLSVNTAIASPLLSRFDIVLVLLDSSDRDWDETVSSFILRNAVDPLLLAGDGDRSGGDGGGARSEDGAALWPVDKLRAYLLWVKEHVNPTLTLPAQRVLTQYYQLQRAADVRSAARTTIRLLESLVRLAQAHARLMCKAEVGLQDAVVAVTIVETSMHTSSMLGVDSVLHTEFPDDPDAEYRAQEALVLEKLGLRATLEQEAQAAAASAAASAAAAASGHSQSSTGSGAARTFLASLRTNARAPLAGVRGLSGPSVPPQGPVGPVRSSQQRGGSPGSEASRPRAAPTASAASQRAAGRGAPSHYAGRGWASQVSLGRAGGDRASGNGMRPPAPPSQASFAQSGSPQSQHSRRPVRAWGDHRRPSAGSDRGGDDSSSVQSRETAHDRAGGVALLPESPARSVAGRVERRGPVGSAAASGRGGRSGSRASGSAPHDDAVESLLQSLEGSEERPRQAQRAARSGQADSGTENEAAALDEVNALLGPLLGQGEAVQSESCAAPARSLPEPAVPPSQRRHSGPSGPPVSTRHPVHGSQPARVHEKPAPPPPPTSHHVEGAPARGSKETAECEDDGFDDLMADAQFLALLGSGDGEEGPGIGNESGPGRSRNPASLTGGVAQPEGAGAAQVSRPVVEGCDQSSSGGGAGEDDDGEDLVSQALSGLLDDSGGDVDGSGFELDTGW